MAIPIVEHMRMDGRLRKHSRKGERCGNNVDAALREAEDFFSMLPI